MGIAGFILLALAATLLIARGTGITKDHNGYAGRRPVAADTRVVFPDRYVLCGARLDARAALGRLGGVAARRARHRRRRDGTHALARTRGARERPDHRAHAAGRGGAAARTRPRGRHHGPVAAPGERVAREWRDVAGAATRRERTTARRAGPGGGRHVAL